jgi:hypothetical protein
MSSPPPLPPPAPSSSPRKPLYRFMAAKWALKSIETRELRVGRLVELNDPFEFLPGIEGLRGDAPLDVVRERQGKFKTNLNPKFGVLSFSSKPGEPTLWSNYADLHKGIALGFDIVPNSLLLEKVEYPDPPKRPTTHLNNPDAFALEAYLHKLMTTKALGWQIESEYRLLVHFALLGCRCENGDYFLPIMDSTFMLVEVILGYRCSLDENYIDQTLKERGFKDVRVVRAKLSIDMFEVEC